MMVIFHSVFVNSENFYFLDGCCRNTTSLISMILKKWMTLLLQYNKDIGALLPSW